MDSPTRATYSPPGPASRESVTTGPSTTRAPASCSLIPCSRPPVRAAIWLSDMGIMRVPLGW